jgi:hypothetical protein
MLGDEHGMKYDSTLRGLRVKPSAEGLIAFTTLTREIRATLLGVDVYDARLIRIQRYDKPRPETWARAFWIPLRGHRQWTRYDEVRS